MKINSAAIRLLHGKRFNPEKCVPLKLLAYVLGGAVFAGTVLILIGFR